MVAATKVCDQRLALLLDRYGAETVQACVEEMIARTELAVREDIRKIPEGTYRGEAATDDDGTVLDEKVWIRVDVTVRGDEITVDFSRSDAQRRGFVNSVYAATYGNAASAVVLILDPVLADFHNEGTLRPIHVVAPEGTVVNARYPATVGAAPVSMGNQIIEAVLEALGKARPARAIAAWGKHRGDYTFAVDPRSGERYVRTSFDFDGSAGAVWGFDGYQGVAGMTTMGAVSRGNVEEMEQRIPWRQIQYEFVSDFSGAGRWRGGPGVHWVAQNEGTDGGMATGSSDGDEVQGFGALGGQPAPVCRTYIHRGAEEIRLKPHRMYDIKTGDIVVKHSSGGGGVGDPTQRDPEMVREDVVNELVSLEAARDVYKVALEPKALAIDQEGTRRLRGAERRRGSPRPDIETRRDHGEPAL
jgi:N-methylhydantoinase B